MGPTLLSLTRAQTGVKGLIEQGSRKQQDLTSQETAGQESRRPASGRDWWAEVSLGRAELPHLPLATQMAPGG